MATIAPAFDERSNLIHENSSSGFWDSKPGKITAIALLLIASIPVVTAPVTLYFAYQIWTGLDKDEGLPATFTPNPRGDTGRTSWGADSDSLVTSRTTLQTDGQVDIDELIKDIDELPTYHSELIEDLESFYDQHHLVAKIVVRENEEDAEALVSDVAHIKTDVVPGIQQAIKDGKRLVFIPVNLGGHVELITLKLGQFGERSSDHLSSVQLQPYWANLQEELSQSVDLPRQTSVDALVTELGYSYVSETTLQSIQNDLGASHVVYRSAVDLKEMFRIRASVATLDQALAVKSDPVMMDDKLRWVYPTGLPKHLQEGAFALKAMREVNSSDWKRLSDLPEYLRKGALALKAVEEKYGSQWVEVFAAGVKAELDSIDSNVEKASHDLSRLNNANQRFNPVSRLNDTQLEALRAELTSILHFE